MPPPRARLSALAGRGGDELGHFFGLLFVEDAAGHAPGSAAVDSVFDRVEDAAFGRFDRALDFFGIAFRRTGRRQKFVKVGGVVAVGPGRVERVAGAAVGLEQRLAALQVGRDLLIAARRVALGAKGEPWNHDCEDEDEDPEPDEGALAHLAARILLARPSARFSRYQGHIRRSAHSPQRGFGRQMVRPWRIRLTWNSWASSGGTIAAISSWARSKEALAGKRPRRPPTRWTWTSTGISGIPQVKISTQAAVLRPTPGRSKRNSSDSSRGAVSVQSRSGGSPSRSRIAWIRGAFCRASPPGRIASSSSATGASRTSSQVGKRCRSAAKARSRLRSLVCWESTVLTSSAIGCPCGSAGGTPYISRSRSRIARTRRLSGRFQLTRETLIGVNGGATIGCSVSRALAVIGAKLPKGWGDAARQIAILVGV